MEESKYELEVISPLIMKGAEKYELRAPSLKGVMRFWFRAMMGCLVSDTKALYEIESSIFGGQDKKSDVTIKIENQNLTIVKDLQFYKKYPYLLFAYREKQKELENCIKENSSFTVSVYTKDKVQQDIVKAAFELISLFGGFGERTRRGFGSVMLKGFTIDDENDFVEKFGSIYKKLNEYLKNHPELKSTRENYDKRDFSTFCGGKFCFIKENNGNLLDSNNFVLGLIEEKWKTFRTQRQHVAEKIYLGLPISSRHHPYAHSGERRASPILFKVLKLQDKNYALVITYLPASTFLTRVLSSKEKEDMENIIGEFFKGIGCGTKELCNLINLWSKEVADE